MDRSDRRLLAGGVAGPVAFAAAWLWGSTSAEGYSMVSDPISRLAAVGATTRPVMTTGLLTFAAGVGAYAWGARTTLPPRALAAAAVTAASSVGIAATPLDGPLGGAPHAVAAGLAYSSLLALVAAGAPALAEVERGRRRIPTVVSNVVAGVSAACLAVSAFGPEGTTGLFQRAGLSLGHAWIAASAVVIHRSRVSDDRKPSG
ncbi:MAG TPA: DUF998 domain-containing protein [Acidimicrobiales bacterium]|nr:DUF998 domain-containing protein [Acidimicrobiales bacterium]